MKKVRALSKITVRAKAIGSGALIGARAASNGPGGSGRRITWPRFMACGHYLAPAVSESAAKAPRRQGGDPPPARPDWYSGEARDLETEKPWTSGAGSGTILLP